MLTTMFRSAPKAAGTAFALSMGLALAGCGGLAENQSLYSVHQPVVERVNYTLDVNTGPGGMTLAEQRRLAGWFEAMDVGYGDRIAIDDPLASGATRATVEALVSPYGLLVTDEAPVTAGYVDAGTARIVITRTSASVPGCPDWSADNDANPRNATSSNYGCATNSNLAAMVANPEDLIKGAETTGETVIMSSTKAIRAYRDKAPTGEQDLQDGSISDIGGN